MSLYIAGHTGLVGSALLRYYKKLNRENLLIATRSELDLLQRPQVEEFFHKQRPHGVIVAAARVGGIGANQNYPADFLFENLAIATNIIHAAHLTGVEKLLFLASSCIYPRAAEQPVREESLLAGPLEPTNEAYAVAKIAGIKLCEAYAKQFGHRFFSAVPCNVYGPGERFDAETSHVIPSMILKFHRAKVRGDATCRIWGSGRAKREFIYSDDLASAVHCLMEKYSECDPINVGAGEEISIADLAQTIADIVGFRGRIEWDTGRPDGTPRKTVDSHKIRALGWKPATSLTVGIEQTYAWAVKSGKLL